MLFVFLLTAYRLLLTAYCSLLTARCLLTAVSFAFLRPRIWFQPAQFIDFAHGKEYRSPLSPDGPHSHEPAFLDLPKR